MSGGSDFLAQHARTHGFSLGVPHTFSIREQPPQVLFLRSPGPDEAMTSLWTIDLDTGVERLLVDAMTLIEGDGSQRTTEQTRRKQAAGAEAWSRLTAEGIADYVTDLAVRHVAFASSGGLWLVELDDPRPRKLVDGACFDPRFDPTGERLAYIEDNCLCLVARSGGDACTLLEAGSDISWGVPEYIASNMKRSRGYWWSPEGRRLAVARVDNSRVPHWHLGNPAEPGEPPTIVARPVAGSPNADVSLWIVDLDGRRVEVEWDRDRYEYLVNCSWTVGGLVIAVQTRDQRTLEIYDVDPADGRTMHRRTLTDPCWVTTFSSLPAALPGGELVWAGVSEDTHTLFLDDVAVTPPGLQLLDVISVGEQLVFTATAESTETHLWSYSLEEGLKQLSKEPGAHSGTRAGLTTVVTMSSAHSRLVSTSVYQQDYGVAEIASFAEVPCVRMRLELEQVGEHGIRTALLLPEWWDTTHGALPVLMDPYGGLGLRKVENARSTALLVSQWFANQGFAVVVADGRGTPGRGAAWERAVHHDIETLPIADQVTALHVLAERHPEAIDLGRVAIRGWSWGGYLAAVCVLRRPDVFHAAIVGAAVADHHLYQSYWKERQLGDPRFAGERYERFSLPASAKQLERPLLLIHGSNDDNVFAAHAMRFSAALTAAGKPHEFLLLPGHGHHAIRLPISRDLLAYQLDFLRRSLASLSTPTESLESKVRWGHEHADPD